MDKHPLGDFLDFVASKHGEENWVTVYKRISQPDSSEDGSLYCALVTEDRTERAMGEASWDLMLGSGGPGFVSTFDDGVETNTYLPQSHEGFRHLVLYRDFHGRKDSYLEVLEEFRLIHNLYLDAKTGIYFDFDESGDEVEVIRLSRDEVKIRRSYLRAFMAATQMNLLLYFELTRHFQAPHTTADTIQSDNVRASVYSGASYAKGYESFVRALGKKLIRCEPIERCGIWPFERRTKHTDFIIGGDVDAPELFTCDPDKLANYFGANPDAPHYLTPVFFKKEVMQKYYGSSDYEIRDGHLSRRGAWSLRFDNNSSSHISVFLGDLGTDLPEKEQTYWRSFNLVPDGRKISRTNYERSFLGNFFDPQNPEHTFKHKFSQLQTEWADEFGWPLFLPLTGRDEHFFDSIRSMLANEQSEFDSLILSIAKVTIDSVNVKALRDYLQDRNAESKSIVLLEALFSKLNIPHADDITAFLRGVQSVRSTGVAHRKGTEYEKVIAKLNIDDENYQAEFDQILAKFVFLFDALLQSLQSEGGSAIA
ncbi:hypothetical protein PQR14_32705 [Paraburkholderia bryophila]|uniref:hypothetical protein n=1 Tax=Paraburkholderia bryophila TaxID=420952 RepID=UPI0038BC60B7